MFSKKSAFKISKIKWNNETKRKFFTNTCKYTRSYYWQKEKKKWDINEQIKLFLNILHLSPVIKDVSKWQLSGFEAFESLWTAATMKEKNA